MLEFSRSDLLRLSPNKGSFFLQFAQNREKNTSYNEAKEHYMEVKYMITLLLLMIVVIFIAFVVELIKGIIVISPVLLLLILLPVVDILLFRYLVNWKRKNEKEEP